MQILLSIFKACDGWFSNFLFRWNYVLRRISTTGRELPSDTYASCQSWVDDWQLIFKKIGQDLTKIYNMDETSIYLDFPSSYTYEKKGKRRVKANTSGGERTRMSAAFTARAKGQKSKIYIVIPRSRALHNYVPPENVVIHYKTLATFNDDVICNYLNEVIKDKPKSTN